MAARRAERMNFSGVSTLPMLISQRLQKANPLTPSICG